MKQVNSLILITLLLFIVSCEKETYTQDKCEDLSIASFRGSPKSAHEFKEHCKGVRNNYPKVTCQKALNKLIMGTGEEALKKEFGSKIMGCFGEEDIRKWLVK